MKKLMMVVGCLLVSGITFGEIAVTNALSVMAFDTAGSVTSLVERATMRQLISTRLRPFLTIEMEEAKGKTRMANSSHIKAIAPDIYRFEFGKQEGTIDLRIVSFGAGWEVEVMAVNLPREVTHLNIAQIEPACQKYTGRICSMISDEESGVVVRSYTAEGVAIAYRFLRVRVPAKYGFKGRKVGIVAGPRKDLIPALRALTLRAKAPRTINGGAWSLGAEANRGSYVFCTLYNANTIEDWVELAMRAGMDTLHLEHWWDTRGHYGIQTRYFKRGWDDWKMVCDKIHAAGMRVGMHTLTAGVQLRDSWMSGEHCEADFVDWCTHTLAKPFHTNDTELVVVEVPEDFHHTFHSYSSHGNTVRIGDEVFQYTGIRREKPYAFTGVKNVASWRKDRKNFAAGEKVHYLFQRYDAFYPKPGSPLMKKVAAQIVSARDKGDVDQIYLDGAEAMCWLDAQLDDLQRADIVPLLPTRMLVEGSNGDQFTWWYLSRYGAWDRPYWGMKRMHDQHLEDVNYARKANLLEPQMGWWNPLTGTERYPGHRLDDMEYFAGKNAGVDVSSSIQGVDPATGRPFAETIGEQLTVLGWYERFRMARVFESAITNYLVQARSEGRLRLNSEGVWQFRPVTCLVHRVTGGADGSQVWRENFPKPAEAAVRIEVLWDKVETNHVPLLVAADKPQMRVWKPQNNQIDFTFSVGSDKARGATFELKARNHRPLRRGSFVYAERMWKEQPFYSIRGCEAFEVWVKGDGSGALLSIELGTPHLYHWGRSPHMVTLNYTGWRRHVFYLRERDAARAYDYEWPNGNHPMVLCATAINTEHLDTVRLVLNDLPPEKDVQVAISEIRALPVRKVKGEKSVLSVNGVGHEVPFHLDSGDYVELEGGTWRRYDVGGHLRGIVTGRPHVALKSGVNEFMWNAQNDAGKILRADIQVTVLGAAQRALKPRADWSEAARKRMAYEAVMPSVYEPQKGLVDLRPLVVRQGEKAKLDATIWGPIDYPSLILNGVKTEFPVKVGDWQKLILKSGETWEIRNPKGEVLSAGTLKTPLADLVGNVSWQIESRDEAHARARIELVKRYE